MIAIKHKATGVVIYRVDAGRLEGANLMRANLGEANLRGANLRNANLRDADLKGVDFSALETRSILLAFGIALSVFTLVFVLANQLRLAAYLAAALGILIIVYIALLFTLKGANLQGADLRGANLTGANLKNVNLREARFDRSTRWPTGFTPEEAGAMMES